MDSPAAAASRNLPRVVDVARRAGVSPATVDRVLNRRPGVRPATVARVMEAAEALAYLPPDLAPHPALAQRPMRLVFLLPAGGNRFLALLGRMIAEAEALLAPFGVTARVEPVRSFDPALLARHLLRAGAEADGIAFMAIEHPAVREAVKQLAARGVPVVTLISDIGHAPRAAYIGLDNRAAGRLAGFLMARFLGRRPAKVAVIAGSLSYRAHQEREMGVLQLFDEVAPEIRIVAVREGHDEPAQNYRQTRMLLAGHPDLDGIYSVGGGAEGIGRALREARRDQAVVFIGHGLTPECRAMLIDGTMEAVITQNPRAALLDCARVFANLRAGRPALQDVEPARSEVLFRENLP
ncbi:LacI family DNA-binding transcriptional regulator [Roseomonas sp. USHLN139]|uniref:LacI family DNA-binding transcriptional regulator n=1 Tax=Roseomonas sp. USHLN139 TaxID=3081298 RepID=UPI003B0157C4